MRQVSHYSELSAERALESAAQQREWRILQQVKRSGRILTLPLCPREASAVIRRFSRCGRPKNLGGGGGSKLISVLQEVGGAEDARPCFQRLLTHRHPSNKYSFKDDQGKVHGRGVLGAL